MIVNRLNARSLDEIGFEKVCFLRKIALGDSKYVIYIEMSEKLG